MIEGEQGQNVPVRVWANRIAPETIRQLVDIARLPFVVDFVAAKVLDAIGVEHDLITRWTGELGAARDR